MADKRIIETKTHYREVPPCRTREQMTQICCEDTAALQCCEKVELWNGYSGEELIKKLGLKLDEKGRDSRGRYVNIITGRSGPCGVKRTVYNLGQQNCCEDVPALSWDRDATPDILPHGKSIVIAWNGSDGRQVEIITSNAATYFADGRKTAIGHGDSIELFAGETFCGYTHVTVRDGCSEAAINIRSDLGSWVSLGSQCGLPGMAPTSGSGYVWEAISGRYRQAETVLRDVWHVGGLHCVPPGYIPLPGYEDTCHSGDDCNQWYCDKIMEARPPEAIMDICLGIPVIDTMVGSWPIYCTASDGALASNGNITYYSCHWDQGTGEGSKIGQAGYWLRTSTKTLYEWRC